MVTNRIKWDGGCKNDLKVLSKGKALHSFADLPLQHLMVGPLCTVCAYTCPWSPGPVPVENSPQRNSEQLLGRMLRLESNQHEPVIKFRKCKGQIFFPLQFQKACFHSLHRFKGRFQQKEETNCWSLLEPQPVGTRQTSRTFLSGNGWRA